MYAGLTPQGLIKSMKGLKLNLVVFQCFSFQCYSMPHKFTPIIPQTLQAKSVTGIVHVFVVRCCDSRYRTPWDTPWTWIRIVNATGTQMIVNYLSIWVNYQLIHWSEKSMLKSLVINKYFQTWSLIDLASCQPIRNHVWKFVLTNGDLNMASFFSHPAPAL